MATVERIVEETARARSIVLEVPEWPGHMPGQHLDVRLTADDGYQAQRSYSIASAPEEARLMLTVERIDDGEVSPYLTGELRVGDSFELRGPIGGHFSWRVEMAGPLLLLGGGSGLVPLMAMLRHRAAHHSALPARLLLSARSVEDVLYRDELAALAHSDGLEIHTTLTRERPPGWQGGARRIDLEMLTCAGLGPVPDPRIYVCGPTPFVERAADLLVELGHPPAAVHTERFGPSGA